MNLKQALEDWIGENVFVLDEHADIEAGEPAIMIDESLTINKYKEHLRKQSPSLLAKIEQHDKEVRIDELKLMTEANSDYLNDRLDVLLNTKEEKK